MPTIGQKQYYKQDWNAWVPGQVDNGDRMARNNWETLKYQYDVSPWAGNVPTGWTPTTREDYIAGLQENIGKYKKYGVNYNSGANLDKLVADATVDTGERSPEFQKFQANAPTPSEAYYTPEYKAELAGQNAGMVNIAPAGQPPAYVPQGSAAATNPLGVNNALTTPPPVAQTASAQQPTQTYNPSLIDIYNARPDVQQDLAKRYPGQNPTMQGTEANTALNDWYNQYGKAEGADMVAKGILTPPTTQGGQIGGQGGNAPVNATGGATDDIFGQFKQYTEQMAKNQTDSQAKIEQLMSKMGEDTTNATLAKFQEMQKGLQDSYNTYFTEQTKYLDELKNQPSAVENLQKFRERQGLPQMEAQLANVDKTILDTEGLLSNIEADIRKRTEGLPVSEAAARRLTAMEQKPLTKQMDELLRSRARVAAGLQAKQQTVTDFMNAQTEDLNKQKEVANAKLGISKDTMEFKKDLATQGFEMFTGLQDSLNKINEMRITQAVSDKDYKNQLAEQGFTFFQQMQAEQKAAENANTTFQNELIKIKLENELKKENPTLKIDTIEDAQGNVSIISTDPTTGKSTVQNMGKIGKGFASTSGSGGGGGVSGGGTNIPMGDNGQPVSVDDPNYMISVLQKSKGGKAMDASSITSLSKSFNVLDQMNELSGYITGEATGPILGILRSNNPYDVKAQLIKAQLTAIVPNLARGVYGEVGVLTDNDVALYSRTLPNLSSTEDLRKAVLAMTVKTVQRSIGNQLEVQAAGGRNVSGYENLYKKLQTKTDALNKNLGINKEAQSTGNIQTDFDSDIKGAMPQFQTREQLIAALIGEYPEIDKQTIMNRVYSLIGDNNQIK